MAVKYASNILSIADKRTEKKIMRKVEVLLSDFIESFEESDSHKSCVIETIDGAFHQTNMTNFDERGVFCSKGNGHYEFFDYKVVKNIF